MGSHRVLYIGPLLFLIYITDIDEHLIHTKTASFADDTRIIKGIKQIDDCNHLQVDLNKIYEWASENNMNFNENKFEHMRYGKNKHPCSSYKYNTSTNTQINETNSVKDLGVTLQDDAKFSTHINNIAKKCRRVIGYILRTFKSRAPNVMIQLFKALVLPIAEYCSILWSPTAENEIHILERIQRAYTKGITGMSEKSYAQRLKALSLYSLQRRRERYQIIYTWKMLNNLVPNFINPAFNVRISESNRYPNRHGSFCVIPSVRTSLGSLWQLHENSFMVRGPKLFNRMPREIREFRGTLETFKGKLDEFLITITDEPKLPSHGRNGLLDRLLSNSS